MAHFTKEGCLDNEKKDWNHRRPILKTMTLETPKTSWSTCLGPMMKMHNSSFYQSKNACATPLSCCTWEEIIVVSNYSTNLIKYTFIYPCFEENRQVVNFSLIFTTYHLCHQTLVFIYLVRLSVSTTPINVWTESRSLVMDSCTSVKHWIRHCVRYLCKQLLITMISSNIRWNQRVSYVVLDW